MKIWIRSPVRGILGFLAFEFLFGFAAFVVTPNGIVSHHQVQPIDRAEYMLILGGLAMLCIAGLIATGREPGKDLRPAPMSGSGMRTALGGGVSMARIGPLMPRDEALYEFIDGRWVEASASSVLAAVTWSELACALASYISRPVRLPDQLAIQTLFSLPWADDPSRARRPDIAFVSEGRWPIDRPHSPREDSWDVVPDLVVEVVSPTDRAADLLGKIQEYFRAGVRLVWVVHPIQRCIHVYEAWDRIRVVTEAGELDGGDVLPGFRRRLDRLFGPVEAEAKAEDGPAS